MSVLTRSQYTCSDHPLPDLTGRYAPGVAVLDNWLFVCGGHHLRADQPLKDL